jgi:DNA repair exonuclease SbcCD ATPase subunit
MNTATAMPDDDRDSKRPYRHTLQSVHPEYLRREKKDTPMPNTPNLGLSPQETTAEGVATILAKLEQLASADLLRRMQGQQVTDKQEILASIAALRSETRTEVQTVRASIDTTNIALSEVSARVKKLEVLRSVPPRGFTPMPGRYDLTPTQKAGGGLPPVQAEALVSRVNELEEATNSLSEEVHVISKERDDAKRAEEAAKAAEQKAQERQAIIATYAAELEAKAKLALQEAEAKAEIAKDEAEAKAKTAKEETDKKAKLIALENARRKRLIIKIGIALIPTITALGAALGGFISHVLHL